MIKKQLPSMESFIKTDKTKVDTKGSINQSSINGMSEIYVPNPPKEVQKKTKFTYSWKFSVPNEVFAISESVMKAEILGSLKSVRAHSSFNSSADVGKLFQKMFPDSEIAKCLLMENQMNYMVCFQITTYFREKFGQTIQQAECFSVFSESLNREFQMQVGPT